MSIHGPFEITIREHHQANQALWWHPTRRPLAHHATTDERTALALGLRILRAQRREDRDAWKSASCLACREECWFHDARHTLCPRCLSVLGVRSA